MLRPLLLGASRKDYPFRKDLKLRRLMLYPIELRARPKLMLFPACAGYAARLMPSDSASFCRARRTTLENAKLSFFWSAPAVFRASLSRTNDLVLPAMLDKKI